MTIRAFNIEVEHSRHRQDDPAKFRNYREMELAVFRGEDPGGVLWQPRLDFWYAVNKKRGTLPEPLRQADILDVYDYCHASVRYFGNGLRVRHRNVQVTETHPDEKSLKTTWETPVGSLTEVKRYDAWRLSAHTFEYRLKKPEDFKVLEFILQDESWYWDQAVYDRDMQELGLYGTPQFYFRRSPWQRLIVEEMGFEPTIYALYDYPAVIQRYLEVAAAADDAMYEVLGRCPVPILNFGENIDASLDSPDLWRKYLAPYYQRRLEQLKAAGKFVHIHVDGAMKPLLSHLQDCPWDGIEAPTPLPQGDVTLEEIKAGLGDLVLLDGIPALYFVPALYSYSEAELVECTRRLVDLFYPRLILGVSDEIPPDSDIERVRLVGELVQQLGS
jgi:hypothetical protein